MSSLRMVYFTRLLLSFLTFLGLLHSTVQCQLDEMAFTSDAQCYGAASFVNATCPMSSSIALINIRVGTRPIARGCLGNETNGDGTVCCLSASDAGESDACEFDFPISDNILFHDQCNGIQLCRPRVQRIDDIHGLCNTSVYPAFTQYMYFNFFCIDDSRIGRMNSSQLTLENTTLYLQSPGYNSSGISSSVSELSCSVETDNCNAAILIYVIERNLADLNSTQCVQTQSLSIKEEDGSSLVNWTCSENTYNISQPFQTNGNYIIVNLTNTMSTDGGKFWIGFQASIPANLTLACPAVDKQYCFPTTTTSTPNTSTTSTTPSTTSTTTSSTTTSSTTKSSTSRTTKTSSTTSTTSKTSTSTRTSSTTSTTKSTSSSVSTQRTVTLTTLTTRTTTSRPNNVRNTLIIATSVSGGVVLLGLIAGAIVYKKKRDRQKQSPTPDKSKPTPPNWVPSTPVSKDDPKPQPIPPDRTSPTPIKLKGDAKPPPTPPNRTPTPPPTPPNKTPTTPPTPPNKTPTPPPTPPNKTPTPPPDPPRISPSLKVPEDDPTPPPYVESLQTCADVIIRTSLNRLLRTLFYL